MWIFCFWAAEFKDEEKKTQYYSRKNAQNPQMLQSDHNSEGLEFFKIQESTTFEKDDESGDYSPYYT